MSYTLDVNGKRYELSDEFREALQTRARLAYDENPRFSCWWKEEDGDPILVIETAGVMVPWENLDKLEMEMRDPDEDDDSERIVSQNGMAEVKPPEPDEPEKPREVDFGRNHFMLTPSRFDEMPSPGGDDPEKIPTKPEKVDEEMMVIWVPSHPDMDETWDTGEAITEVDTWTEWNVQKKANQPRPQQEKTDSHDAFESLCKIHDCEVVAEAKPSNDVPSGASGQVERKGEDWYDGDVVGDRWSV